MYIKFIVSGNLYSCYIELLFFNFDCKYKREFKSVNLEIYKE